MCVQQLGHTCRCRCMLRLHHINLLRLEDSLLHLYWLYKEEFLRSENAKLRRNLTRYLFSLTTGRDVAVWFLQGIHGWWQMLSARFLKNPPGESHVALASTFRQAFGRQLADSSAANDSLQPSSRARSILVHGIIISRFYWNTSSGPINTRYG